MDPTRGPAAASRAMRPVWGLDRQRPAGRCGPVPTREPAAVSRSVEFTRGTERWIPPGNQKRPAGRFGPSRDRQRPVGRCDPPGNRQRPAGRCGPLGDLQRPAGQWSLLICNWSHKSYEILDGSNTKGNKADPHLACWALQVRPARRAPSAPT